MRQCGGVSAQEVAPLVCESPFRGWVFDSPMLCNPEGNILSWVTFASRKVFQKRSQAQSSAVDQNGEGACVRGVMCFSLHLLRPQVYPDEIPRGRGTAQCASILGERKRGDISHQRSPRFAHHSLVRYVPGVGIERPKNDPLVPRRRQQVVAGFTSFDVPIHGTHCSPLGGLLEGNKNAAVWTVLVQLRQILALSRKPFCEAPFFC